MTYEQVLNGAQDRMDKALKHTQDQLRNIRTSRASAGLVENIRVEYYGTPTPLNQLAQISTPEPRQIVIKPYDAQSLEDIGKAIMKSDLGLNPATAGDVIRIPMPPLTEETRRTFIKQAKHEAESARVSVRNARRDANSMLKELLKDKEISEDEERRAQEEIQKLTDRFVAQVEKQLAEKEADLLEI